MKCRVLCWLSVFILVLSGCGGALKPSLQPTLPSASASPSSTIQAIKPTQPTSVAVTATPEASNTPSPTELPATTPAPAASSTVTSSQEGTKGSMTAKETDTLVRDELSDANTRFGIALLKQIVKQDGEQNTFISPASIAIALAMTYNGASGETQKAMAQTLQLNGMSLKDVNTAYAALRASLMNVDPSVQLDIANSLWVRQGTDLNPSFVQRDQQYFDAQVQELDFTNPSAAATINNWVSQNTKGKIAQIVDRIPPQTVLYLINAIYFKGAWAVPFDPARTTDLPFHPLDGSTIQVPMMSRQGTFTYLKGSDFQAVSLPYGNGRLSMLVFLPDATSSLAEFEGQLNETNWNKWMSQLHEAHGMLRLPRFQMQYGLSLNEALKALGMANAFDPQAANFSAMRAGTGPQVGNFYISDVQHKTYLEVNEQGTEAAAVTSVGVGITAVRPQDQSFSMIVDRPFFIAIRDEATHTILFMGEIAKP